MTVFKTRRISAGGHVELRIFAGPDHDHLALLGVLRCNHEEADALDEALRPRDLDVIPVDRSLAARVYYALGDALIATSTSGTPAKKD